MRAAKMIETVAVDTYPRMGLFESMACGSEIILISQLKRQLYRGTVNQITREDGSGRRFLVRLHNSPETLYVETI